MKKQQSYFKVGIKLCMIALYTLVIPFIAVAALFDGKVKAILNKDMHGNLN